jgi:hypothetical protein
MRKIKKTTMGLMAVLLMTGSASAADTFTIPVSITMPAIPGVNTPLIEEQTTKTQGNVTLPKETPEVIQKAQPREQNTTLEKTTTIIEEEARQEKTLIFVKTFYAR